MKNKKLYIILSLQIIVVFVVASFFIFDYSKFLEQNTYIRAKNCNLKLSSCKVKIDTKEIEFEINPKNIPLMKTLSFRAKTNFDTDKLILKIQATNMDMGKFEFILEKIDKNTFQGSGILPTCVVGNMIWEAKLLPKNSKIGSIYYFQTK